MQLKCSRWCERAGNEGKRPLDRKLEKRMSETETLFEKCPEWFTGRQNQHPLGNTALHKAFEVTFIELKGTLITQNGGNISLKIDTLQMLLVTTWNFSCLSKFCVCVYEVYKARDPECDFLGKFFYHNITTSANNYCFF